MKFARFEVRLDYLLTSHQEGWQINSLCNPAVDAVKPLFLALESSFIYMPVNGDELVAAARVEFARTGISCPAEFFSTSIQYFVNSQLSYIARRAASRRWSVEREVNYGVLCNYRADLKVMAIPDEYEEHKPFAIWFESDNADVKTLRRKFGERISVIGPSDAYISFVYANSEKKWLHLENAASCLYHEMNRHVDAGTCRNSLGVLSSDAPSLYKGVRDMVVNTHLILDGSSMRVAEFHFGSDSQVLNEWVTDESGIRYPHRDPPPSQPKSARIFGLRGLLRSNRRDGGSQV